MKKKKCIHIFGTPLFPEELCQVSVPRIRAYAERIGADVRMIGGERRFPDYPLTFERFQIYERGWEYEWNICIDADIVIGSELPDVSETVARDHIGVVMLYPGHNYFSTSHRFFSRYGNTATPVQAFLVSSDWTHDIWEPLKGPAATHLGLLANHEQIAEYALAYNIAKFGLKFSGAFQHGSQISRVRNDIVDGRTPAQQALATLATWGQL